MYIKMRGLFLILVITFIVVASELIIVSGNSAPDVDLEDENNDLYDVINGETSADKRSPSIYVIRRSCIRRGGNCDHRPNDCCYSSSCRCNLWGSNCRCQRVGLFQKWG